MKKKIFRLVLFCFAGIMLFASCKKEFTVTVQSNNTEWGTVSGGGTYTEGTEIYIEAQSYSGCEFVSWQDGNTENPRSVTVKSDETFVAVFAQIVFSVSETQKVFFSSGNLQWSAEGTHAVADGGTAAGTWRFALNQWDTVGIDNENISSTYSGWIDLFGWGTSGYDNKYPYIKNAPNIDYGNGNIDISGTYYDWGVYNAIYNPHTNTTDAPGTWRTLTKDEWVYLLETRNTASEIRYAKGSVNGVNGLIVVPDNWNTSIYPLSSTNTADADFTTNNISSADWTKMEARGCVFLPASGFRVNTLVLFVGSIGYYRSTKHYSDNYANSLYFYSSTLDPSYFQQRNDGQSVRLVKDVQ